MYVCMYHTYVYICKCMYAYVHVFMTTSSCNKNYARAVILVPSM